MRLSDVPEDLASKAYVVVILRLLFDRRGRLVRGEAIEASGGRRGWFSGWRDLPRVLRLLLAGRADGPADSVGSIRPQDLSDSEANRDCGD